MNRSGMTIALIGMLALTVACGSLGNIGDMVTGSGAGTASTLWPDVPPFPGAEKADLELPLVLRLGAEAISKAIMTEAGDAGGNIEFIAFSTDAETGEVEAFYTQDRMTAEGWSEREDTGCGMTAAAMQDAGAVCAFYKEGGARDSILILMAVEAEDGQTSLYYLRMDANPQALATAAAE